MPSYQVVVPGGGTYNIDSPTEMTDAQAWAAVQWQISNPPKQDDSSDFVRGLKSYLPQTQELIGDIGVVAGQGVRNAFGKGAASDYLVNKGMEMRNEANTAQEATSKPSDSLTEAWKQGIGTVVTDWLPYQMGQGVANIGESLAFAGAGAAAGAVAGAPAAGIGAIPGAGIGAVEGLVSRTLIKKGIHEAAEAVLKAEGKEAAKEFIAKESAKALSAGEVEALAKSGAKAYGQNAGIATQAIGHGIGETGGRAIEQTQDTTGQEHPENLDFSRLGPAAVVHAGADYVATKIGLGSLEGLSKPAKNMVYDIAKNIGYTAAGELPAELVQQAAERYGANLSLTDKDAIKEYIDTAGAVGAFSLLPGTVGGIRTSLATKQNEAIKQAQEKEQSEKDRLQKEIDDFKAPEGQLMLPAPPKTITPKQEDLLPNPMGNISREELGPEVTAYIDKHRADNNLPHLQSYSIEDVKDAMTGVNPAGEQGALDAILTSKTGFSGTEKYSPIDVIAAAAEKNVATETKGFNDFLTRTTGAPKLEDMSQPQLYAAFTALKQMDRPATGIQLVLPEGSNASRQQSIAPVEQPKIDLPTGHTIQQVTLQDGEKPSAYAISVQGAGKPLVTVKTKEEADTKSADIHQERQKEAARTLSEVMAHEAAIKTSADNLTKMETDGQAGTEAYAKAQAQHALKEQVFGGQIESLYNKIEGLTAPLDVKPVGMEPVTRTAHVLTKDGKTLGTYPTHVAAENAVLSELPDDQLNSVVSDKRFGGFSDRAAQEQNRRQSAPPEGKKVSDVLGAIEEEKQAPIRAQQIADIHAKLSPMLERFGLKGVGLNIVNDLNSNEEGSYTSKLIKIALNVKDHVGVLRHEAVHALKEMGFFTPQQWQVLMNKAQGEWTNTFLKQRNVDGQPLQAGQESRYDAYMREYNGDLNAVHEEAIADAFRHFDNNKSPPGMIAALLHKVKTFFSALNNAVRGAGFQTAEGVFGKVERGELTATAAEPTATAEEKPAKASIRSLSDQQREGMKSESPEENARNKYVVENHAKALEEYNKLTPQLQKKLDAYRFAERKAGTGMSKAGRVFDKSQSKSAITKAWNAFNNEFKQHFGREMNQDEMNAHYGDPQKTINEYLGEEVPTKKASLRTEPLLRSDRNTGKFAKGENTISTRKPTSAKPTENPNTDKLNVGIGVVAEDPKLLAKHAELIKDDPLMGSFKSDSPEETINHFIEALKNNLLHLWNATPKEIRERSRNWYKGANKIANNLADQAGISENAASGVLAALSPQTPWDTNVSQATRVITIWKDHQNTMADQSMSDWFDSKIKLIEKEGSPEAMIGIRDAISGKTFKQLEGTGLQPWWLRAYDETHHSREYHLIAPEGKSAGLMLKKDGTPANMPWGNTGNIEKALSILNNDSIENISNQMGDAHKVRSFYNNIVNPDSPDGHVTIDTHAVAAARFEPLSGNAPEVAQAWGGQGSSSIHGQGGLYGEYAEAYRRAAEELGVLPREVQSVTWEKVRGLFPDTFKTKEAVKNVKSIWNEYKQGKLTEEQVRKRITDISPNQNPNWHGVSKQSVESAKSSPHEVEPTSGAVRSGQAPSGAKRGTAKLSLRTAPNTPAFKQFFGKSVTVDKNGKPKVMYHGTARDITEFRPHQAGAIFVTDNPETAERYTQQSAQWMSDHATDMLSPKQMREATATTKNLLRENGYSAKQIAALVNDKGLYKTDEFREAVSKYFGSAANILPVYVRAENPFDYENPAHVKALMERVPGLNKAGFDRVNNWTSIEGPKVQEAIKAMGFDSFYVAEHGDKNLAVYEPTQIKSAIGNEGTYSRENPDIRKSLRRNLQDEVEAMPGGTDILKRVYGTTTAREEKGWIGRMMEAISPTSLSKLRAQALNRYNQLSVYDRAIAEKNGGVAAYADKGLEAAALMSDLAAGVTASVLGVHDKHGGVPVYKNGYTSVDSSIEGPIQIFAPLAAMNDPFVYRLYQFYAASHRGVRLNDEGREENFTLKELAYAKALGQKYKEFESVRQKWLKFNDALVDYQVATGVLSKDKAAEFTKYADYVPFYRQLDGESTVGPNIFQSLTGVKGPKKLKGSEAPLADFLETVVRNTQAAVQAGMKNTAGQKAVDGAVFLGTAEKLNHVSTGPDTVTVLRNGKPVSYKVADEDFIHAVKSLNLPELPFLSILAAPSNLLRNMVTKDPGFILANMMRDSLSAYVISGIKGNPLTHIASVAKNFGKTLVDQSPEYQHLLKAGVIGGYDFAKGIKASGESLQKALTKNAGTETGAAKLFKPATKLWGFLEHATEASDAATRIEVFKKTLAETGNEAEALFRALEVMNFNRKGSSAVVRIATAAIPFLNARVQGLDVFYRNGIRPLYAKDATAREKEVAKTFVIRGLTIMALSVMYAAAIQGDPDYEKQEQETKDNNWLIPSLGIRIPIPFEVGTLFKTIPERIYHLTTGHDTPKDFQQSMTRAITNTFMINPVPQIALPIVETMTNYSFFTGRQIIGQNMTNIEPEFQSNAGTSKIAIAMGHELGISPIKIDHIFQGYTGAMGTYASNLIDSVINVFSDNPSASKRFEQTPVLKRFLIDPEAKGKVSAYYDLKDQVDTVVRTINMLQKAHDPSLEQYWKDHATLYTARHYINNLDQKMQRLNSQAAQIRSSAIPADEKRDTLLEITKAQNALLDEIQTVKKELSIK